MKLPETFLTSIAGLKTNKSRSTLTILGIVIGVTAIMLVMSLGKGAQDLILGQIQGLGSKTIAVIPGREPSGPSDAAQMFSDSLKYRDLELLRNKSEAPHINNIMPVVFGGETGQYEKETYRLTIFGGSELIFKIFDLYPSEGSVFSEEDVRGYLDVAVIGSKVKDELFPGGDALNKKIRIKGRNFRVIGVLPAKGAGSFFDFDEMVLVPYTTAQQYIFGIKYFHRFIVEADEEENIDPTVDDIKRILRSSHNIENPDKDDFFVSTQADLANRLGTITTALTLFLASVASISLFVGGIGIMNIMLVSVTERTKEIGLRKSIGATDKDILMQFLFEAVILTGLGGITGIFLGVSMSFLIAKIISSQAGLDWAFSFPYLGAFLGIAVSGLVGVVFGIYPARKASKKSPMEALRYE